MSLTTQPAAYLDCYKLYELAIAHNGCRAPFPTETDARYFQLRMNQARVVLRTESRRAYPTDHHLYDKSEFDAFKVQVLEDTSGEFWIYVKLHGAWDALSQAEPIPTEEQDILPPPHHPRHLTLTQASPNASKSDDLE